MQPITSESVVIGVDTRKDVHVAVARSGLGIRLGCVPTSATADGYRQLAEWRAAIAPDHSQASLLSESKLAYIGATKSRCADDSRGTIVLIAGFSGSIIPVDPIATESPR